MSRFGYIVSFVCCALVLGASVFTVCAELPDAMIEPKWYATGVAFIFVGIVWAVVGMVRPGHRLFVLNKCGVASRQPVLSYVLCRQ